MQIRKPTPTRLRFIDRFQPLILLGLFAILQVLIIAISYLCGYFIRDWPIAKEYLPRKDFLVLSEAYNILTENSYQALPETKKLEYGMIKGMVQAVNDPYTVFVEPPQHELQTNTLEGRFGGIGIRIDRDSENFVYIYPLPGSKALAAGVKDGDRLLSIEDLVIMPQTTNEEVQAAIRGPVGEPVKIVVARSPDFQPIELTIERGEVAIPSITWNVSPEAPTVGVVQIRVIADSTPDELTEAIDDLQEQGVTRYVLDLRNNSGGLVEAGVNAARLFLKEGIVIEQQYRDQEVKTYHVDEPGIFTDLNIALLVNHGTASAAEIFTGALQGQGRALVIGSPTYGKDTIQLVFSLSDGSSLHVTAAQWWVPGKKSQINGKGLQPDILVADDVDPNIALQAAIQTILK